MLKRLELIGFKSFADKTTFTFGDGISAIVGPNGSGKSNIVDAVRWILGEQSAKSLRGGEMADVIFNGSNSRRSFGMAEVTITFDNHLKLLPGDAEEVQVTRRVYRSGEGEYLLNGQPCRLRDIKELFLGSGAGGDAYCIIEQGKVDVLLQASTKERRIIFEEAAGISRFKAKKIETLRKLERVEQNLARLKDIIDEVDKQLRSVKLQASKAERFQEYTSRLKELRIGLGLTEYHELTGKLYAATAVLDGLKSELEQRAATVATLEADARQLDQGLSRLDDQLREEEAALGRIRELLKQHETTLTHEGTLALELEAELGRTRLRLTELKMRVAGLAEAFSKAHEEFALAEERAQAQRRQVRQLEEDLEATVGQLTSLHRQVETDQAEHLEQMRQGAHRQNDAVAAKAQVDNLRRGHRRLTQKTEHNAESLAALEVELHELTLADQGMHDRLALARQALTNQRLEREQLRQRRDETGERVSILRQERSGLASRVEILQGLIRSHEGLGTGVREVFALLEQPEPGPWATVLGIVADFLTVRREYAPLIDLALGDAAQRFLVRDMGQLSIALAQRTQPFSGRVSFFPLPARSDPAKPADGQRESAGSADDALRNGAADAVLTHSGVIAPAGHLVSCDRQELAELPALLLSRTLIVRDLDTARSIADQTRGYRLITLQGELLEPDGTLSVGKAHAATGFLSRKSELHELLQQVTQRDEAIALAEAELANIRGRSAALDDQTQEQQNAIEALAEQSAELRARLERHRERRQGLDDEVAVSRSEMVRIEDEISALEKTWHESQAQAAAAEARVQVLQQRLADADRQIRIAEVERQERQQSCTAAHVTLAKIEEHVASLSLQQEQLEADLDQRRQEQAQGEETLAASKARLAESQRTMLDASSALAQGCVDKEVAQRRIADLLADRDRLRRERGRLGEQVQTLRGQHSEQQEHVHGRELEVNDLRHGVITLADRLREDYQVELAELYEKVASGQWSVVSGEGVRSQESGIRSQESGASEGAAANSPHPSPLTSQPTSLALDAAAVNEEIAELRRKLSRLGNVNLEALQELQELESRSTSLAAQFNDLTTAKKALEEIISKINQDSRRLFGETFQSVRTHFQELFRKLFGGGMDDIVFEDENDILESGIEVIARPPGKELRSISLMSGGEKTLTAVALLLAIFRSKPSPFCILDEVDAALDEANIERYTAVLREFLDRSQFIIVTHSKKTMASADVLYGITMQESGISKQVTVRFEDWPEDAKTDGPMASTDGNTAGGGNTAGIQGPHRAPAEVAESADKSVENREKQS